ncbi:MAG: heme oxygenase (biliverdin-producing) [Propionibacteriaceae bacterium]
MKTPANATGLAAQMREGSRAEHEAAEESPFMAALLGGEINAAGYLAYLERMALVYAELERVGGDLADDPIAAAVLDDALLRGTALAADLTFWRARTGADAIDSPAADAYVAAVGEAANWGGQFVAHHYTRYLGDLSGGQAIGRIIARTYGLTDGAGTAFYAFAEIPKPKPYKDGYRARLDALPLSAGEQTRVVAEVRRAFRLNQAVFAELADHPAVRAAA